MRNGFWYCPRTESILVIFLCLINVFCTFFNEKLCISNREKPVHRIGYLNFGKSLCRRNFVLFWLSHVRENICRPWSVCILTRVPLRNRKP